ncbi:MAG: hypothetical protein AAGJ28_19835 [Pseudomonadota bacterium]
MSIPYLLFFFGPGLIGAVTIILMPGWRSWATAATLVTGLFGWLFWLTYPPSDPEATGSILASMLIEVFVDLGVKNWFVIALSASVARAISLSARLWGLGRPRSFIVDLVIALGGYAAVVLWL